MEPLAALLSERPPQLLSATELHSRIALLEDAARAYRTELESRTSLDALPDEIQQLISESCATRSIRAPPWPSAARARGCASRCSGLVRALASRRCSS